MLNKMFAGGQDNVVYTTNPEISSKRQKIERRIEKANADLKNLQNECPHENVIKKYESSTGNYDPHNDSFWIEHRCIDCGKIWTIPN
jgi:hypothetical protein